MKGKFQYRREVNMRKFIVHLIIFVLLLTFCLFGYNDELSDYYGKLLSKSPPETGIKPFVPELFSITGKYKYHLHSSLLFSPDNKEFFFTVQDMQTYRKTIIFMKQINNRWTSPEPAAFSGIFSDEVGWFSKDGCRLYFFSTRPIKKGEPKAERERLWLVQKNKNVWGKPVSITQPNDFRWNDGPIYVSAELPGGFGSFDIYKLDYNGSSYDMPKNIGVPVNTEHEDIFRCISRQGDFLIFYRFNKDNKNAIGLYLSFTGEAGVWEEPIFLSKKLNLYFGFDAKMSPNGEHIFILNRKDGIYWVKTSKIRAYRVKK
jgi:hypothetical protein